MSTNSKRRSQSFSPAEVLALDALLTAVARQQDPRRIAAANARELRSLAAKTAKMRERIGDGKVAPVVPRLIVVEAPSATPAEGTR